MSQKNAAKWHSNVFYKFSSCISGWDYPPGQVFALTLNNMLFPFLVTWPQGWKSFFGVLWQLVRSKVICRTFASLPLSLSWLMQASLWIQSRGGEVVASPMAANLINFLSCWYPGFNLPVTWHCPSRFSVRVAWCDVCMYVRSRWASLVFSIAFFALLVLKETIDGYYDLNLYLGTPHL